MINKKKLEAIFFSHISEDSIIPGYIPNSSGWPFLILPYFIFFVFWLILIQPWQNDLLTSIVGLLVFFAIPIGITIVLLKAEWLEINRKDSAVNIWTNSKKRHQLHAIKKENTKIFYQKEVTSVKYGTLQYTIFLKDNSNTNNKRYKLFTLPKGIPECVASELTKEVSKFIIDFLNKKPVKPENNQYIFTYHV